MDVGEERNWWRPGRRFGTDEVVADGVVHAIGIIGALAAGAALVVTCISRVSAPELTAAVIYLVSLLAVLSISLFYNMWPISRTKQLLARLDQAAIFVFIAATYTPFLVLIADQTISNAMLTAIWGAALCGVAMKLVAPHSLGHFAILLYLGMSLSGLLVFHSLFQSLPTAARLLLVAGGVIYILGIAFHLWEKLRFQTALWHTFVIVAAMLHFGAVFEVMVAGRT